MEKFLRKASKNHRHSAFALKCDVSKFFDSVDHQILLELIKKHIKDDNCLWLIEKIIKSFEGELGKGLPLGNVTSQLFANIYLNELDQFVKRILRIKYYIRYCDDFLFVLESGHLANDIVYRINEFLRNHLNLRLHPKKILIRKYPHGIDFLGYVIRPYCRTLRTKTKRRLFVRINERNQQSYLGLLKHCASGKTLKKIFSQ